MGISMLVFYEYLSWMLVLYWCLSLFAVVVTVLDSGIVPTKFKSAVKLSAARGKLWEQRPKDIVQIQDYCVPHYFFKHFYALGAVWISVVLVNMKDYVQPWRKQSLIILLVHVVRRFIECAFIQNFPKKAKMHILAYNFGLSYYIALPVSLVPEIFRSLICSQRRSKVCPIPAPNYDQPQWYMLGLALVVIGQIMQFQAHIQLRLMQSNAASSVKKDDDYEVVDGYCLPKGGLFNLVDCPHYFAEIVIYTGFLFMAPINYTVGLTVLPLCWVIFNLSLAASATHKFYTSKFKNYPQRRKTLIPFVI